MITIEKCSNGFVVYENKIKNDSVVDDMDSTVFEEQGDDMRHIQAMLYKIMDALDIGISSSETLRIVRINSKGAEISNIPDSI